MATAEINSVQQELETRALTVPEQAKALKIVDAESYERGTQIFHTIKDFRREINATFDPIIDLAHKAHKEAIAQKKKVESPLVEAETILRPAMAAYEEERRRIQAEAQRKAEEEARKIAEDEALAEAAAAEAAGDSGVAEAIINSPVVAPHVVAAPVAPTVKGVSYRDNWSAQVTDMMALVKAVAAGTQPITLLAANLPTLNQMARALKGAFNVPGCRAVCDKVPVDSRR